MELYFVLLPKHLYLNMIRFRTANQKQPIETGRWNIVDVADRKCTLCKKIQLVTNFITSWSVPSLSIIGKYMVIIAIITDLIC